MPIALFDSVSRGVAQALTFHHRRHEILATNIANIETPGYRARDFEFDDALEAAFEGREMAKEQAGAFAARVVDKPSNLTRPDGNTVDLDLEMARLADNRSTYTTMAEILGRRFAELRRAIEQAR
jgi:flagellar basal-body rod protein FlgB